MQQAHCEILQTVCGSWNNRRHLNHKIINHLIKFYLYNVALKPVFLTSGLTRSNPTPTHTLLRIPPKYPGINTPVSTTEYQYPGIDTRVFAEIFFIN